MESNTSTKVRNILLDHYETPINVTLSTPTSLKYHYNEIDNNKNSSNNKDSEIKKLEGYISKKYDETALNHLRKQILKEVSQKIDEKINSNKLDRTTNTPDTKFHISHISNFTYRLLKVKFIF